MRILYNHLIRSESAEGICIRSKSSSLRDNGHSVETICVPASDPESGPDTEMASRGQTRGFNGLIHWVIKHAPEVVIELPGLACFRAGRCGILVYTN